MTRIKFLGGLLLALTAIAEVGRGQVLIKRDQAPLPIDAAAASAVIEQALKQLEANYVFPEVAAKIAKAVRARQADKQYDKVKTGQQLAELLTKHLQEVSKDKHLRVFCSTEKLPKRKKGKAPGAGERERMQALARKTNAGYVKAERLPGNVGYLELSNFAPAEAADGPAAAALNFLANTDALIIDLRRNGGGSPTGVALLCSYFFDEKPVHLNSLYWRKGDRTEKFFTRKDLAGKRYLGRDVYVLTSSRTFSGAEEFAYNLQCLKRATVVGETTGGGAHPGGMFPLGDHFAMFISTGRAINPITKTNWEGTGVKPDVAVPAAKALDTAHRLAVKKVLAGTKDERLRRLIESELKRASKGKDGPAKKAEPPKKAAE
jgi:hypothetical protein